LRRRPFHIPEARPHYPRDTLVRPSHFRIDLRLDFQMKKVEGFCEVTLSPVVPGLREVRLDASGMDIRGVAMDGRPARFDYDGQTLKVETGESFEGSHVIRVDYSSTPAEAVYFVGPDDEYPDKPVQAWTQNEADFASHWFPCVTSPAVKSSSELVLRVPKGFRAISNGVLVSSAEEGGLSVFHWKEDIPHSSYLTSFVVGEFSEIRQEARGVPLSYFFPERKRKDVLRYFGETPKMIEVFEDLTGVKYPYKKYAQTTVEDFIFGGMENLNATTLAMNYYPEEGSAEDFQSSYSTPHRNAVNLVAHELAHQWFGDLVTCRDWTHAWLNEGFATYMQNLYLERTRGADVARWDLGSRGVEYFGEDEDDYRRAIVDREYVYSDDLFDNTLYEKGAWMIHELRYVLGDRTFFAGVKRYLEAHRLGSADTHDFRRAMEEASGRSLERFFEQSFYREGYPEFEVEYSWDEESKAASFRVKQTHDPASAPSVFVLPCDLVLYEGKRRRSMRVSLDSRDQTFTFTCERRPDIAEFDPQHWLLKKVKFLKTLELLRSQLSSSEDASSRADAARSLGELKANGAVRALAEAAAKEQFWGVKDAAIRALGEIGTDEALLAVEGLGLPGERRVRRAIAAALGAFKQEGARSSLARILGEDESPYVRCEAALSVAKSWPEGALPLLKEAMKVHTTNEALAEACLEACGKLPDGGVPELFADSLKYGRPTRVRIGALKGIKARGRATEEEVRTIREILLRDKEFRVRQYVISTLIPALGDARFAAAAKEASEKDRDYRIRRKALEAVHALGPG
jgi:aminopeptidase N